VPWRNATLKPDKRQPTIESIDKNMHDKWDKVLNYLVAPKDADEVGPVVERFFKRSGLIIEHRRGEEEEEDEEDEEGLGGEVHDGPLFKIGSKGYEFLLQNIHVQVFLE
jgi:hypothetical protein